MNSSDTTSNATRQRKDWAVETARQAGEHALALFRDLGALTIERKGAQDFVSNADRAVEMLVRDAIAGAWPEDGIVGEEYDPVLGQSGYVWVIDPIDGTTNYINGIPAWTVVLALVHDGKTVAGVIFDPCHDEMFEAERGGGAVVNGKPLHVSTAKSVADGSMGTGIAARSPLQQGARFISALFDRGGMYYRNASGALMLAYVAAGRLIGYAEPHMYAWDCFAGLLMIEEAGGLIAPFDEGTALTKGLKVIAGGPDVFNEINELAAASFEPES